MASLDDFFRKMERTQLPTAERPWFESIYTDPSDFDYFTMFVNGLDNIGRLNEYHQPFFFRGHADARWPLKPKIVRLLEGMALRDALAYEFEALCYFRERAHIFAPSPLPRNDDLGEWLCLMQHFCAPTRMLDWTTSFSIALYFAVADEPLDLPGAVWLFETEPLQKWMDRTYPDTDLPQDKEDIFGSCQKFVDFGLSKARPKLDRHDPEMKSARVTAQRSVFTYCEQLLVDHTLLIGSALWEGYTAGQNHPLWKLILTPQAKRFFRRYLSKLNITAATLFPGTDGLGRTICETIRVEREAYEDIVKLHQQPK